MNNILLLIDFSPTSKLALEQGLIFARLTFAEVIFCHVSSSDSIDKLNEIEINFKPYIDKAIESDVAFQTYVPLGNLLEGTKEAVNKYKPGMVITGTHGKRGVLQHLFGSNIFNLIKEVNYPFLVLNNQSKVVHDGFKNVLIPVSHHTTYLKMLEKTVKLLATNGKIKIFAVVKYGLSLDREVKINTQSALNFLNSKGIENEYLEIVTDKYTKGYSTETLQYIKDQEIDLITIFTKVSDKQSSFALTDKENIILNDLGVTVLCVDC